MPVIRWIMNHMVVVFVGALVIAGAIYQEKIEMELAELGYIDAPEAAAVVETESAPEVTAPAPVETPEVAAVVVPTPAPVVAPTLAPAVAQTPAAGQMPTHLIVATPEPAKAQPAMAAKPQMAPSPMPPSFGGEKALEGKIKELWVSARTAFWKRDMVRAEELYKKLVNDSAEPDAAGELGNLYYIQRRHKEAADMYFEAANRHLKGDNPMQAGRIIGPLSQIAPDKAKALRQELMAVQAKKFKIAN